MSLKRNQFLRGICLIGLAAIVSFADQKPAWKGTISKEGDVVVVKNPKTPLIGAEAFSMEEDLSIGGQSGTGFIFGEISSIAVSGDGTIAVLDGKENNIKVFSREGKLIKTFGRAGEGPGELGLARFIYWTEGNELMVPQMTKLSFFKPTGELIREVSLAAMTGADFRPASRGGLFGYFIVREEANPRYELRKLDSALKILFPIESSPLPNSARDGFKPIFPIVRWAALAGDRVVCGYAVKNELRIHDADGRLVRKIQMSTDQIPVSQKDIEERSKGVPPTLLANMKVPKYYPYFRYLMTDDEDRIYVVTFEPPSGKKGYCFDIFDAEGKYIAKTILPAVGPLIRKGCLYAAEENEEGYPVLKRYKVSWKS
jgi:hypothetical protein